MTVADDVQTRLNSYKTNKQRKQRIKELARLANEQDGYMFLDQAIERAALMMRLEYRVTLTAQEMADQMYAGAVSGALPMHVHVDGEHEKIPPEAFKKPH